MLPNRDAASRTRRGRARAPNQVKQIGSKKPKRTLLPEECPQRARAKRRLTATRTSPEVLRKWRGRKSSPGFGPPDSPSRLLLQSVAFRVCVNARYSGGAAPASHRFPWLPSAVDYLAKV